jgi:hypothetical protein
MTSSADFAWFERPDLIFAQAEALSQLKLG